MVNRAKIVGGAVFSLFLGGIVYLIFFQPPSCHVSMQWGGLSWSWRAVVPTADGIFVAEHTQIYSRGGRRVIRLSAVAQDNGELMAQRHLYGDIAAMGVTTDHLLWVDRMSRGGVQAVRLPNLEPLERAGDEIIFADPRLVRPRRVYVDQSGHLVVKARDGLLYQLDPVKKAVQSLGTGPEPPAQLQDANSTWFFAETSAGRLEFPHRKERRQLELDRQPQPPAEGYLEGRLLGDRLSGAPLVLPDGGRLMIHQSELGSQAKFRLTGVSPRGEPRWTIDATTLVKPAPYENYKHAIQWSARSDKAILLYTVARESGSEKATQPYLISLDAASGRPLWITPLGS